MTQQPPLLDLDREVYIILKSHNCRIDKLSRVKDALAHGRCKIVGRPNLVAVGVGVVTELVP
jgi:hypothetical protein